MVQGLAFLSKKSWHTKNLANQEKVWMAEQRKAAEESKTKELAKQIQQEREEEELAKIAGRKTTKRDRGIDWMYEGGRGEAAKEEEFKQNEEYLMGKEFQPQGRAGGGGDFADLESGGVINEVITKKPAAAVKEAEVPEEVAAAAINVNAEPSVADRNEAFRMRHEDPMFLVSQTQQQKQTQQDKKRALYERVVGPTVDKNQDDEKDRRRLKKERKRERKQRRREEEERGRHHRKRHRRSRSRSRSSSRERDHSKRRHKRRHYRSRSRSPERRRNRSPERSYSDEDGRHESRRRSRSPSYERRRYRSRSKSPRDYHRHRRTPPRDDYDRRDRYERPAYIDRKPSPPRRYEEERRREEPRHFEQDRPSRPEGFGLQGGQSTSSRHDLGPNRQLLDRKRQERDSERQRNREAASNRRRMTDEERAAALEAMARDASKRDELLNRAVAAKSRHGGDAEHAAPSSGKASFLQDMAERTHGIRDGGSLASRVAKNRHTNQKLSEDFL